MELSDFFEPIDLVKTNFPDTVRKRFGHIIKKYTSSSNFPSLDDIDIAIIGVEEDRAAVNNMGCSDAPDVVREYLYKLFPHHDRLRIADLGNIKQGFEVPDTYFALTSVVESLIRKNLLPIILGGSQDLTYANYLAYENIGRIINIASVDPAFDFGDSPQELSSQAYLSNIILHQPNFLFNYTNIGYQSYFVDQEGTSLMRNLFFDAFRLGKVNQNLEEVEPMVRNADMKSIDISAVRFSDAPGNNNASPNGLYGEELCAITRYAGLSDKLSSIGFYELNPRFDKNGQTAHLVAQAIWYFVEGYYNRFNEFPFSKQDDYLKYIVNTEEGMDDIVFYKSRRSDRWWMEVNGQSSAREKYERHYLVPCSYQDYETACENDIPDRWWQAYQKMM